VDEDGQPQRRDAGNAIEPPLGIVGRRWAVVVGISRYRHPTLNLRFAHRDANDLWELLRTPEGGNYASENTRLLLDEKATTAALTQAVRGFLLKATTDDLVLLYFACHGGPDPRRPSGPLYLYTHDTDPRDVAGTAFAMDEVERSLRSLVQARRAVIIVDTCHSAGIAGVRAAGTAEATNRYLDALARATGGIALLTSAEAAEASEEDERWGGGHGVFTYYLLKGMRGAADGYRGAKDGIVSVGELFEFVRDRVRTATDDRQHPSIGTRAFDRNLPMAVTGDLDVEQHLTLSSRLIDVGWLLDDPAPFLLAARQLALASDLKRGLPTAEAARGEALLAAGRPDEAARVLEGALATDDDLPPDAWLHLGMALAEDGRWAPAAQALRQHRQRAPQGDYAEWADSYASWLEAVGSVRLHGLLIGVGHYGADGKLPSLPGVANDLMLMQELLTGQFGAAPEDLTILQDTDATGFNVLRALDQLQGDLGEGEVLVVYYGGHSNDNAAPHEPYLFPYDVDVVDGITPAQLVAALDSEAREVVLILDTHVSRALVEFLGEAPSGRLTALLGTSVGELAYESTWNGRPHGNFTPALVEAFAQLGHDTTYEDVIERTNALMASSLVLNLQTAQLIGRRGTRAFQGAFPGAALWRAVRSRATPPRVDPQALERDCAKVAAPLVAWTVGRVRLDRGEARAAVAELERAAALGLQSARLLVDLADARLAAGPGEATADAVRHAAAAADHLERGHLERAQAALAEPPAARPAVLAVGADPTGDTGPSAELATRVAEALAAVVAVPRDEMTVLSGREATRGRVMEALRGIAAESERRLALLVLVGRVTSLDGKVAYSAADGGIAGDDLANGLRAAASLVSIASFDVRTDTPHGALSPPPGIADDALSLPALGAISIYLEDPGLTGNPILQLAAHIREAADRGLSYREWLDRWAKGRPSRLISGDVTYRHARVLEDRSRLVAARHHLAAAGMASAADAAVRARAAIAAARVQQRDQPEGFLQLGLALQACRRWGEAIDALRTARNLYDDQAILQQELRRDPATGEWHRQARYHCGRLQYLHGSNLNEAVASLRAALEQDRGDPRVLLHLAQAVRTLIERENLVEAKQLFRHYMALGAPLGGEAQALDFLTK
jgi:tetratricopeptide (TPR) repeat protein